MSKTSVIAIVLALTFLVALTVYNNNNPQNMAMNEEAWNNEMTVGSNDAPNRIVEYGDYFCQYCTLFHEQVVSEKFKTEYLDTGKIRVETRPITVLAGEHSPNTEQGAEAAFCAADQKKYTEFSEHIIPRIKTDFFDKGIGVKAMNGVLLKNPKAIEKLPQNYFNESATAADMDIEKFDDCMKNGTHKKEIATNTDRAIAKGVRGLPHIVVNNYVSSGFAGGWDNFQLMLKAGKVK